MRVLFFSVGGVNRASGLRNLARRRTPLCPLEEIMKRVQSCLAWLSTLLMITANLGWEGCGEKENTATASAQSAAPSSPAGSDTTVPTAQNQPQQPQQENAMQLPEVNLTPDGLDELLAPIALYPNPGLAIVLQSSVDPQQVMDGGNWLILDENKNLQGAALDQASQKAGFTPVMQALLHYPSVVDLMCAQFDWTKQIGAAYQANPKAVLDSVQRLRAQAVDNGAIKSGAQMKVDVTQDNGQQVVKLEPTNPKVIYVPQYDPSQVFQTTTTTTTTGPASVTSTSSTTVVQQQSSGVSTGTAVAIGLLSFGAGIALGAAINNNNYYYPAWGHGGVWYGPRPYYPPPYRPVYYGGWHVAYYYHRPAHYGNTNIYINNTNNYYNRFQNNNNLKPSYKPRPVPYNNNPNSTYSRNMGSRPEARQGVNYRPSGGNTAYNRPAGGNVNAPNRPGNAGNVASPPGIAQRPANANNAQNWKGQTTYAGARNNQANSGNVSSRNPSGDRGFAQNGGARPTTGNMQANRPNPGNPTYNRPTTGNPNYNRPSTEEGRSARSAAGNQPAARTTSGNPPSARPATQNLQNRQQPSNGGALGGANDRTDRAASQRGRTSMGAPNKSFGERKR